MKALLTSILSAAALFSAFNSYAIPQKGTESSDGTSLIEGDFKVEIPFFSIEPLAKFEAPGADSSYWLLTGTPCPDCNKDRKILIVRAKDGQVQQFILPGKIVDAKTKGVVFDARAFYGKCLNSNEDGYVVFQKEQVGAKRVRYRNSVFVAKPGERYLEEKIYERGLPSLDRTLKRVKKKECFEIARNDRTSERVNPMRIQPEAYKKKAQKQ